jgi:hypothetical protein
MYPYKWSPEQPEDPPPKDRTCCLVLELGGGNYREVVIVPISGHPSSAAIEMTPEDIRRAGLSSFRRAYIHPDQHNLDLLRGSYFFNPRQEPLGKLSKRLLRSVTRELAGHIKSGRAQRIARS